MARGQRAGLAVEKETGRVEAFSDGVFAIAITLLVLTLHVPPLKPDESMAGLAGDLTHQWPAYIAFVTSFATILIMWTHHHAIFALLYRADVRLLVANGLLLLIVTVVPFPTALVATHLLTPAAPVAVAVYAATFAVGTLAYNALWWAAVHDPGLLAPDAPPGGFRAVRPDYVSGFPPYLAAVVLAFWNAYVSLAICFALWILWALTSRAQPAPQRSLASSSEERGDGV